MTFCFSFLEGKEVPFITEEYNFARHLYVQSRLWSHCGNDPLFPCLMTVQRSAIFSLNTTDSLDDKKNLKHPFMQSFRHTDQ